MQAEKEFIEIIERSKRMIYKVCYVYAPQDEVEDYFQEIVLALWRAYPGFRGESGLSTWVYRIALHTCITFLRRSRRRIAPVRLTFDLPDERDMQEHERLEVLHAMIFCLGRLDRALLLLWLEERNYEEIAAILGISRENVAVRLSRIRVRLRKMANS